MNLQLAEKQITEQVVGFMTLRGWRAVRKQVAKFTNPVGGVVSIGEKGMADYQFIWYLPNGISLVLWVEMKAPDGQLRDDQVKWITREMARGGVVYVADDFRVFEAWYYQVYGWLHQSQTGFGQLRLETHVNTEAFGTEGQGIVDQTGSAGVAKKRVSARSRSKRTARRKTGLRKQQ